MILLMIIAISINVSSKGNPLTFVIILTVRFHSFIDIIGEITAVKSSVSDPPADNNHLMATIKLEK